MKEKISETNPTKGYHKLVRILRFFPFNPDLFETDIKKFRHTYNIIDFWNAFWVRVVVDRLESSGFFIPFKFEMNWTRRGYRSENFHNNILSITDAITKLLDKCEKKPKRDIYHANNEYLSFREFFHILINTLTMNQNKGHWSLLHKRDDLRKLFFRIFGFYNPQLPTKWILTPDDFITRVNEILKDLGFGDFSILANGIFRYVGVTAEAEEKKRAYSLLVNKKFDNVIECLDSIDDTKNSDIENKENICLDRCRYALESFYKRLLLNHGINTLYNGKPTEKGTVNPVAETVRKKIGAIFSFPIYSKNMETGFNKLIEASKNIVSGLADDGGAHGKSKPPKVNIETVKASESFIMLLINTLLPFEK